MAGLTQKVIRTVHHYRLPIISGVMIGTSYIPFQPWALFFCLTPLFLFWYQAKRPSELFWGGWITQFVLNLIGFHWIAKMAVEFGHFNSLSGFLILIIFCTLAHLHFAVAGLFFAWIRRRLPMAKSQPSTRSLLDISLLALLFAICENLSPMIFPWHMGYTWLWAKLPGIQIADIIGFEGLNYFTILINALIAVGYISYHRSRRTQPLVATAAIAIGLVIVINWLGVGRESFWKNTDAELKFLTVQGNIGNFEKFYADFRGDFRRKIIEKYLELTRLGLKTYPDSDFIVWPETAYPTLLDHLDFEPQETVQFRKNWALIGKPLMTGSFSQPSGSKNTFNSFFLINEFGQSVLAPYHKTILLIFGERFPFTDIIPYMDWLFPGQGSLGAGPGPSILNHQGIRVGPQICYEGLYPWLSAGLANRGAEIFVNVTNDSWYGENFEPYQHLYMTLARAIEFRRPLVRATNTGVNAAVLATGEVLSLSPVHAEWTGQYRVPYLKNPPATFYQKFCGLWIWTLAFLALCLVVLRFKRSH
jgi:apolipoprotein N-acyltransferase